MGQYVDGYVIVTKKKSVPAYKKMAALGRKVWMDHGAMHYYECVGEDLNTKWGIPFPKLCKAKTGETVIFAFIVFKSKAHRDRVNKKVHEDPRMKMEGFTPPFDMKRFSFGGFDAIVHS